MLRAFRQEGIEGGIFGDIDFNPHREWIERVCQEAGITPHLPLWMESHDKLLRDFIDLGFESIVISAKADLFGEEILGLKIDADFIKHLEEMRETKEITLSGEAGEYHTLVIDGPLFRKRLKIMESKNVLREGRWFLEVLNADLETK